jgi:RES domain-containing protein
MLPDLWMSYPSPHELSEIGDKWKWENSNLVLKVPSAVVKNEWNYLVNPSHQDFPRVRVLSVEEYLFDARPVRSRSKAIVKFDLS